MKIAQPHWRQGLLRFLFKRATSSPPAAGSVRRLKNPPEVRVSVREDGMVLLNIVTGRLFAANRVGAAIWNAVLGGSCEDAVPVITARFGYSRAEAQESVERFVSDLMSHGLLTD